MGSFRNIGVPVAAFKRCFSNICSQCFISAPLRIIHFFCCELSPSISRVSVLVQIDSIVRRLNNCPWPSICPISSLLSCKRVALWIRPRVNQFSCVVCCLFLAFALKVPSLRCFQGFSVRVSVNISRFPSFCQYWAWTVPYPQLFDWWYFLTVR